MLTEKDYCDYEICVALKELGYNGTVGECSHFGAFYMGGKEIFYDRLYNSELKENECLRVPLYLAQKWLRERHNLHITIYSQSQESWQYRITKPHQRLEDGLHGEDFSSYEEALSEGIKETVKILKNGLDC